MVEEKTQQPFSLRKSGAIDNFIEGHYIYVSGDLSTNTLPDPRIDKNLITKPKDLLSELEKQIAFENLPYPVITIKLKDILQFDEDLFQYALKDTENFLEDFEERLLEKVKYKGNTEKFLKDLRCQFEKIHLIFDVQGVEDMIPVYDNFSLGTKGYVYKLVRVVARFLELDLFRENVASKVKFECKLCGSKFEVLQFKEIKGKYTYPNFCINQKSCKAKAKNDFRVIRSEDYHEVGYFRIGGIDFSKQLEKECYTFYDYDYFVKKKENINFNDIVEVVGLIKLDYSDLGTRKENQVIREYVQVIDFNPIELKTTDPSIIEDLVNCFKEDKNYHIKLVDDIHYLTRGIYTYRILKMIYILSYISSDSWDTITKNRCSINTIVGSIPSQYKSTVKLELQKILGVNNIGTISGQDNTPKAFIPTSQRGKEKDFEVRYGALAYHYKKLLFIDEAQYMLSNPELAKPIKYLEDGFIDRGSDGTILYAPAILSVCFLMNYLSNKEDEGYDHSKTLKENLLLGSDSILQRIDLHYAMLDLPPLLNDVVELRLLKRETPSFDSNRIYNYLNEAKRLFPLQKIPDKMNLKILSFIKLLRATRGTKKQNARELRTLIRLVCGISALRLKTEVDISDLQYVKAHFIDLMIPFYDSKKVREIKLEEIDLDDLFQDTLELLTELKNCISLSDHISVMKQLVGNHFTTGCAPYDLRDMLRSGESNGKKQLLKFMLEDKYSTDNKQYRKLYESETNREFIEKIGYTIAKKSNKVHYVKRSHLVKKILGEIKEVIETEQESIEREWILREMAFDYSVKPELLETILNELIESNNLVESKKGLIDLK